jgi:hypothetical protein
MNVFKEKERPMIRLIIAMFASLAFSFVAQAQSRDVYTVRGIQVDERAGSVIAAKQEAFAAAKLAGAKQMLARITLPQDLNAATGIVLTEETAALLAAAVDVEEETAGAGRYRGRLAVVFNPTNVRALLNKNDVPYTDRQAAKVVIVPVTTSASPAAWTAAWGESSQGRLAPTVTTKTAGFSANSDWNELRGEASFYGVKRAVIANLTGVPGRYSVQLISVSPSGNEVIATTSPQARVSDAANAAAIALDGLWKQTSIIRDTSRTLIEATVRYTSLAEWNTLRGALARSPLVSDFQTKAIAVDGAVVAFVFAGDAPRLTSDLRDRGVRISAEGSGWVMTSAITAVR